MGLFIEAEKRGVALRTRTACELAEISYERLYQLLGPQSNDSSRLLYAIGSQLSQRLLDTSRKAGRLAFLDVTDRIVPHLHDLAREPDAMSHPQGTQMRVSRQELARLVGCSRRNGRTRAEEARGRRHAARARQDRRPVRHTLMAATEPAVRRRPRHRWCPTSTCERSRGRRRRCRRLLTDLGYPCDTSEARRAHLRDPRQRPPGAAWSPSDGAVCG
jgi:hypothetical protein